MFCFAGDVFMDKNLLLKFTLIVAATTSSVHGDTTALQQFTNFGHDFKIGDSFTCFSDEIATLGFMVPPNSDKSDNMGELTTYKNVGFGFSILNSSTIKFSKSYPFSIFGNYFEANAGMDNSGHIDYNLGLTNGKIRRATPDSYFLRVVGWGIGSTDIMHETCEKL